MMLMTLKYVATQAASRQKFHVVKSGVKVLFLQFCSKILCFKVTLGKTYCKEWKVNRPGTIYLRFVSKYNKMSENPHAGYH